MENVDDQIERVKSEPPGESGSEGVNLEGEQSSMTTDDINETSTTQASTDDDDFLRRMMKDLQDGPNSPPSSTDTPIEIKTETEDGAGPVAESSPSAAVARIAEHLGKSPLSIHSPPSSATSSSKSWRAREDFVAAVQANKRKRKMAAAAAGKDKGKKRSRGRPPLKKNVGADDSFDNMSVASSAKSKQGRRRTLDYFTAEEKEALNEPLRQG